MTTATNYIDPSTGKTTREHWRHMLRGSFDGWAADKLEIALDWLMEEQKKPVAESRACTWHAAAVAYDRLDLCNCVPCEKERKWAASRIQG